MEATGLGIGVPGLAGLITSGRDAKVMFDSYKNAAFESQPLLAQRNAAQILLQQWIESVGYSDNQFKDRQHPAFDDPTVCEAVERTVQSIRDIDGGAGAKSPGGTSLSSGLASRQQGPPGHPKGPVLLEKYHESISRKARLSWAIKDKNRASEQTQNVAVLLHRQHDLVPPLDTHGASSTQAGSGTVDPRVKFACLLYFNKTGSNSSYRSSLVIL